jgi:Ca2+-transporting ATPase
VKEKKLESLQNIGGVDGVASALQTNVECGIHGDVDDIARRNETFGSNTYKRPPTKSFFHFVWEEFKDLTILFNLGSGPALGIMRPGTVQKNEAFLY